MTCNEQAFVSHFLVVNWNSSLLEIILQMDIFGSPFINKVLRKEYSLGFSNMGRWCLPLVLSLQSLTEKMKSCNPKLFWQIHLCSYSWACNPISSCKSHFCKRISTVRELCHKVLHVQPLCEVTPGETSHSSHIPLQIKQDAPSCWKELQVLASDWVCLPPCSARPPVH